jgi:uncharacterized membrane protein YhaH (DUF805 family)
MAKKRTHPLIDGLFRFEGRMRRSEYWMISIGLGVVKAPLGFLMTLAGAEAAAIGRALLELLFLWPSVALMVKRGHDRNRSALYTGGVLVAVFLVSVAKSFSSASAVNYGSAALIGAIFIYIFIDYGCLDGTQGPNRYGRSPKGVGGDPDDKLAEVFA